VGCGDIAALVGVEGLAISDTVTHPDCPEVLPVQRVDEPTMSVLFRVNDSPFAGREGSFVTSRHLRERLHRELHSNVALRVEDTAEADAFKVSGRGTLHLGVLIEKMRREGYEFGVGKPRVIFREIDGRRCEPVELLVVDVRPDLAGKVIELVGNRRGEVVKMDAQGDLTHLEIHIPARGLVGLRTRMLTATAGEAVLHHVFHAYEPVRGEIAGRGTGVQISMEPGRAVAYALDSLQDRGDFFVAPGDEVYEGQIVGEHCRGNDIVVNVCRTKKLTNMRAAGSDRKMVLAPPKRMALEEALEYIEEDELVEVTPRSMRLRKRYLKEKDRKRARTQETPALS
jgi:GTP-binding protein